MAEGIAQAAPGLGDYFMQRQLEIMMDTNNKKVLGEVKKVYEALDRINAEIESLKNQISSSGAQAKMNAEPECQDAPKQSFSEMPSRGEIKATVPSSRTGDYCSEDVSIEKFFYFGANKK